ncbi:MAG: PKD domain-containing protein, partial [Saprospiraceae bacterium]|nr:PKD domain-containing protein [Saprospiraceae bacterium]
CEGPGINDSRNYTFIMKVYRDCAGDGAQFDQPAEIGVYRRIGGAYSFVQVVFVNPQSIVNVPPPDNPCLIVPENVCVQEAVYQFQINNLPVIDGSYFFFWRRCCRNSTINNIVNPRNTGATYSVEITALAQQVCNDSPRFNDFPPTVICVNEPLDFDHGASDLEGDQLVYEFCAPLHGGGPAGGQGPMSGDDRACNGIRPDPANCPPPFIPVTFIGPNFSVVNPLAGDPKVTINANTGRITGTPNLLGQFVVGVCVKEYRNGVLLSVLQRDFQFNVSVCEVAVTADILADTALGDQSYVINSCGNNTVDFINLSERESSIISYRWEFDLGGGQVETITSRDATVTFPGIGAYAGTMIVNEGLTCSDTANIFVNVYPEISSDFVFEYDTCFGAPVEFTDLSYTGSGQMVSWAWDFGEGSTSSATNPDHLYPIPGNHDVTLVVTDINNCVAEQTKTIPYFPVPPFLIIEPSTFNGCAPAEIFFNNLSVPIDSTYNIVWDFGDGNQGFDISPTHRYENEGLYTIRIEITSPIGCFTSAVFPDWIRVRPSPLAGFDYSPAQPSNFNPTVSFFDQSIDAVAWQWRFSDEAAAFVQNPTHTFQDTGFKLVEQVVFHPNGCTDTAWARIDIAPQVRYYLPNAFTPNNDSKNDGYRGTGVLEGVQDFELTIWSRWGELVFETNDPAAAWNGRFRNTGEELPPGVYLAQVTFVGPRNIPFRLREFATLIR